MMEIGSLADWVSGLASVVAVATALFFWVKDREDSQNSALTDVSMWTQLDDSKENEWVIFALNNTKAPIWNWYLEIQWNEDGEEFAELLTSSDAGLLPPGQSRFPWKPCSLTSVETSMFIKFGFEDSTGQCWLRETSARLKKVSDIDFD